jgi:beta-lactamase regulating signal transducer with metallopeptidase domain
MDIIRFSLSVSLFVLVVVMLRVTLGFRLPKMTFRALWIAVSMILIIPVSIPSYFSVFNLIQRSAESAEVSVSESPPPSEVPAIPAIAFPERPPPIVPDYNDSPAVTVPECEFSLLNYLHYALIAGSVAVLVAVFALHVRHKRKYELSLPCEDEYVLRWVDSHKLLRRYSVRTLDTVTSPLAYGILKPVILLPSSLDFRDENKINCILYHEFVHIKRFDVLWKFLFIIALAVHWFNPLIWVAFVLMNRDIELSCDEEVVKHIGGDNKSKYAEMLVDLTQKRRNSFLLSTSFGTSTTRERVRSIMKFKKPTIAGAITSVAIVAATVAVFATSAMGYDTPVADDVSETADNSAATADSEAKARDNLSAESELRIRQDWLGYHAAAEYYPESVRMDEIKIYDYLGTYNGAVAVVIALNPTRATRQWEVEGRAFTMWSSTPVHIWHEGEFYSVAQAYDDGLLTAQDVGSIFARYRKLA